MKKHLLGLSLLSALVSSSASAAGPVANIQVTGDIKPPTCTVDGLEQNDVVFDFGVISPSMVPQSSPYSYYKNNDVNKNIVITCDAETYLTFKSTDSFNGSSTENLVYSTNSSTLKKAFFNLVPVDDSSVVIGGVSFAIASASVDGQKAAISRANDGVINTSVFEGGLVKEATMGWTAKRVNNVSPDELDLISGKIFTLGINSDGYFDMPTFITSQDALTASGINIADGLDFMGEAVLTFNFGV